MTTTTPLTPYPFRSIKSFLAYAVGEERIRRKEVGPRDTSAVRTRHSLHIAETRFKKWVEWGDERGLLYRKIAENIFRGCGKIGRNGQPAQLVGPGNKIRFTRLSQEIRLNHDLLLRPQIWRGASLLAIHYHSRLAFIGGVVTRNQKPRRELDVLKRCDANVFDLDANPAKQLSVIRCFRDGNKFGALYREITSCLCLLSIDTMCRGLCGQASCASRYLRLSNALYRSIRTAACFIQSFSNQPKTSSRDHARPERDHHHIPSGTGHTSLCGEIKCFCSACITGFDRNAPRHTGKKRDQDDASQNARAPSNQGNRAISCEVGLLKSRHATPIESVKAIGGHQSASVNGATA